ncbi:MAG TPA: flagellar protein [Clostridiales bacterium]|jgi:flagellar operon protein|nr:flagellar protein [Clostridiales bacterium]
MDDIRFKFYKPVVTGTPGTVRSTTGASEKTASQTEGPSFQEILLDTIKSSGVNFSKHAVQRAARREIEVTAENLARLNEGIRMANEKNLGDTLILIDGTAYLVNAKNNTIITALSEGSAKGRVFTNIEGTVIV